MSDDHGSSRSPFLTHHSSVAFVLIAFFLTVSAFALEVPPAPAQWFTDRAGLVDSGTTAALNDKLRSFEQRSGAQFIVYIAPTLGDEALESYTIRCAEAWKAGNKKYDNGLILFVFAKEKKIRLEVGYGLEPTMTDAFSSRVIREVIVPRFRQNDYAGGLSAGVDAVIARIEKNEAPVAPVRQPGQADTSARPGGIDLVSVLILLFVFFFFIMPMLRRRGGGCGGCFWPLFFLGGGGRGGFTLGGGGGGWGGGGGGFSGGGGSFGGGGASGSW